MTDGGKKLKKTYIHENMNIQQFKIFMKTWCLQKDRRSLPCKTHETFHYIFRHTNKVHLERILGVLKNITRKICISKCFSCQNQRQKFWKFSFDKKFTYICTLWYHICIQNVFSFHLIYILCMLVKILDLPKLWSIKKLKIFAMRLHNFRNVIPKKL